MSKKKNPQNGEITLITSLVGNNRISVKEIQGLSEIEHPIFSFRYLHNDSYSNCNDASFFIKFLERLQKLSELGWKEVRIANRHGYGMEKIPIAQLNVSIKNVPFITPEVKEIDVFRSNGDNRTFVGVQKGKIFYILFIETRFGDICPH